VAIGSLQRVAPPDRNEVEIELAPRPGVVATMDLPGLDGYTLRVGAGGAEVDQLLRIVSDDPDLTRALIDERLRIELGALRGGGFELEIAGDRARILGIATDTGSFRHGPISSRTFEICQRIAETGVEPARLARQIFDSFGLGRVKLTGALLNAMELHHDHRLAVLEFDDDLLASCGAAIDDTEGLVNLPLGAREVKAVALLKRQSPGVYRVSMRSKGEVDVRGVAMMWGGGGHTNAAGFTITGSQAEVKSAIVAAVGALDAMRQPPAE